MSRFQLTNGVAIRREVRQTRKPGNEGVQKKSSVESMLTCMRLRMNSFIFELLRVSISGRVNRNDEEEFENISFSVRVKLIRWFEEEEPGASETCFMAVEYKIR
jgi:hypothetical protein